MRYLSFILLFAFLCISTLETFAQGVTVSGKVLDEIGMGLPGATVVVEGTTSGTVTNIDGEFTLSVPSSQSNLLVSFVGYETQTLSVAGKDFITVKMSNTLNLEEVIVVGFGTQKRANATGAVRTIDNKVLESRPLTSVSSGLQGAIAGLNITNDLGGAPGQEMKINIRGVGTIDQGSNSSPLVLINGMEGDISSVNPNDIENVSVLKDAASAAIYGSRAPFGVILITTKSGSKKKEVTYTSNVRLAKPLNVPDIVDSYTYALMINDAFINSGEGAQFGSGQLDKLLRYQNGELQFQTEKHPSQNIWLTGQQAFGNNDWYDIHLKSMVTSQEHNLSLTGGGDNVVYYFSTNFLNQNGLFTYADDFYDRFSINGRVNVKLRDNLSLNWNTRLVTTENNKPSIMNDLFFHNLGRRAPNEALYFPNGELTPGSLIPSLTDGGRQIDKNQLLYNQAQVTYEPIKDWKIYADLGSRLESPRDNRQFTSLMMTLPDGAQEYFPVLEGVADVTSIYDNGRFRRQPPAGTSYYEKGYGHINYLSGNFRTDYELYKGRSYMKFLVGVQTEQFYTERIRVASDDILIDEKPFLPSSSGNNPLMSERKGEWTNFGLFSRINYVFADKYMAEINFRSDAASRFPEDKRWGYFPSFSLGWNIAEEAFAAGLKASGIDVLKIRGSYGTLGNQNTSSFYPYFQKMNSTTGGIIMNGQNAILLKAPAPFTTNLTWERIENIAVGLDWNLFSNRISGSLDWYQRNTKDMVGPAKSLPSIFGATPPSINNAELKTEGWEFEATYRDRIGSDFSFDISVSISDYQSEVTKYDSPDGSLDNDKFFKGKKLGDIWGYRVEGMAKSDLEMQNWLAHTSQTSLGTNWGAGDFMYKDLNGSGSVNRGGNSIYDPGDLEVIGNSTPRYFYGLRLNANYKFMDFSLFFQGVGKRDVYFENSATFFGFAGPWQRTLYTDHLDYFRPAGEPLGANLNPYYARLRTTENNRHVNDYYLQNAAYLRLKNAQIGFSLPKSTFLSGYVQKARLYFSGENLLTLTNLMILDPESVGGGEFGSGKAYPMYATYSIGLSITF